MKTLTQKINGLVIDLQLHSIENFKGKQTHNIYTLLVNGKLFKEFTQNMGVQTNSNGAFIETYHNGENAKKTIIVKITSGNNVFASIFESKKKIESEVNFLTKNKDTFFIF